MGHPVLSGSPVELAGHPVLSGSPVELAGHPVLSGSPVELVGHPVLSGSLVELVGPSSAFWVPGRVGGSSSAFWVSGRVGGSPSASFVGTWGRLIASLLVAEGRFKTLLKCSAHLSTVFFLSVLSMFPSALRMDGPDDLGPHTSFSASLNWHILTVKLAMDCPLTFEPSRLT